MATVNMTLLPAGAPALGSGGQFAAGPGDAQEPAIVGQFSVSNTGTATDTVNYIDGTAALPFTPSGVLVFRTGGTAAATISAASVSGITNILFVINWSATPAVSTLSGLVLIFK